MYEIETLVSVWFELDNVWGTVFCYLSKFGGSDKKQK